MSSSASTVADFMIARVLLSVVVLGAGAACQSPTGPENLPATVQVVRICGALPSVSVAAASDTVRITGAIVMNVPCYRFTATASWQRDTLVVTLAATGTSDICTQDVAAFSYAITVTGVRSGSVPLRLVYDRYGLPQYFEIALEQTVQVP